MASSSRKAFWLLKSLNHVQSLIHMIENYEHATDECYVELIDILEQIFLIIYYLYENLVFIARTKLVSFTEDALDSWGNMSWFLEDLSGFMAAFLRVYINARKIKRKRAVLLLCASQDQPREHVLRNGEATTVINPSNDITNELKRLEIQYSDSILSLVIAMFELGASAEAINLFKNIFGVAIGDTGMGLCGVTSSILILYEATLNAMHT